MATHTAPVLAGSVSTRMALSMALMSCSGRTTRSQYRHTGRKASLVDRLRSWVCSTCWSTGSGWRQAYTSPGRISTGMLLAVAVAAAVTMLAAPGPTEEVTAMIFFRLHCLAKATAVWAMPCSFLPCHTCIRWASWASAWPRPTTLPWPGSIMTPSTKGCSMPS